MHTKDKYSLGIDIGGTKVNIGIFKNDGKLKIKNKYLIIKGGSCYNLVKYICENILTLIDENGITLKQIFFTGVGVPGTVDSENAKVIYAANVFWKDEPIGEYFKEFLGIDIKLIQDTRAAALGELLFGAGRGYKNIVCITLGTGIGAGIIINKKIYNGLSNAAGELGHIIVSPNGRKCNCGQKGCLEAYASGNAIQKRAEELFGEIDNITTESVFKLAEQENNTAKEIIKEMVKYLSIGIVNIINILQPEAVILSGGLSSQEKLLISPLKRLVSNMCYLNSADLIKPILIRAELGEDAPVYGAGMLYRDL